MVAEHETTSRREAKSIAIIGGAITRRGRKTRTPLWVIACPLLRFHLRARARFSLYAARNHFNEPLKGQRSVFATLVLRSLILVQVRMKAAASRVTIR